MTVPASRCGRCGLITTPPEPFGCEQCGAPASDAVAAEIEPVGTVTSFATVHRHHRSEPQTPFTVLAVRLDAGPALKGVYIGETPARIGDRVTGDAVEGLIRFAPC